MADSYSDCDDDKEIPDLWDLLTDPDEIRAAAREEARLRKQLSEEVERLKEDKLFIQSEYERMREQCELILENAKRHLATVSRLEGEVERLKADSFRLMADVEQAGQAHMATQYKVSRLEGELAEAKGYLEALRKLALVQPVAPKDWTDPAAGIFYRDGWRSAMLKVEDLIFERLAPTTPSEPTPAERVEVEPA